MLEVVRLRLLRDLIETVGPELRQRKRERRVISFDDMLHNLYAALTGGTHPELAAALRERFPVALIDEFQDTDPLQFAIFERIYGTADASAFFVGDPKQAIYSFRHADLHAYLRARRSTSAVFTLARESALDAGLDRGVERAFRDRRPDAFMLPGLDYQTVEVGGESAQAVQRPVGQARRPAGVDAAAIACGCPHPEATKRERSRHAATAAEIARLLTEGDRAASRSTAARFARATSRCSCAPTRRAAS